MTPYILCPLLVLQFSSSNFVLYLKPSLKNERVSFDMATKTREYFSGVFTVRTIDATAVRYMFYDDK